MGGTSQGLIILLLAVYALAIHISNSMTEKKGEDSDKKRGNYLDQIILQGEGSSGEQEVPFGLDNFCPEDCQCNIIALGYGTAKCNHLKLGTHQFRQDITDLIIENADPEVSFQLDDFIFEKLGLRQIAVIKIVNSTITSVRANTFFSFTRLNAVHFSYNKLRFIHPETFANNKKLLLLTLSNNPLKFPIPGSQEYFLNASSVQELDVSHCNIQHITANTFKNMPGLMYLNVAGNKLSFIEADTFKKLLDLEELDLSDNNIKVITDVIFAMNIELASLHIQRNQIDSLYGLQISDLTTLNAGESNIKFIEPSMLNGFRYVVNLNLSGNSIEKIHNQSFHKLFELNYLDLSYNNLDFISEIIIKNNIELEIFNISNNHRLKHLPAEGFNCSAEQFNIYLFDASFCGIEEVHDNSLKTFTALSQINLSGNKIKSISTQVFSRSSKLANINLAYNMLTDLDVKVFEKNKNLDKLNLQGNPLKVLSAEIFVHTPLLSWLDISHAELTSLWQGNQSSTFLSNLIFLNISHNRITEVNQFKLDNLHKLRTLDVNNNLLTCNRDFENLLIWLNNHKISPISNPNRIAGFYKDIKYNTGVHTWDFLLRNICWSDLSTSTVLKETVSDTDIWESTVQGDVDNFDLKLSLDNVQDINGANNSTDTVNKIYNKDVNPDIETDVENDEDEENDTDEIEFLQNDTVSLDIQSITQTDNASRDHEPFMYLKPVNVIAHHCSVWSIVISVFGVLFLLVIIAKIVKVVYSKVRRPISLQCDHIVSMSVR